VLRRVRDPLLLARVFGRRGLAAPAVRLARNTVADADDRRWLAKPRASGGGHGIGRAGSASASATRPSRGWYLQERIDGTPASVVFVAAGGSAVPLGVSRQLVGEPAFGAEGYRYCGSILAAAGDAQLAHDLDLVAGARTLVATVAEELGVVGVNGIDFVARAGVPYPIEVNPRYSASMELVERAYGLSVFGLHASACSTGALPAFDVTRARLGARAVGKAIVFAQRDVVAGNTGDWLGDSSVRDVPSPGERILLGRPVCTVFAEGRDAAACHAALVRRAARIYEQLTAWEREVA
jgi:predicted ATP-grasp superfamily ATP-dependent carboligase